MTDVQARHRDVRFELADPTVAHEPGPFYDKLRRTCPVAHTEDYGGFWIISRYDDVHDAARNPTVFSSAEGVTIPRLPIPPQVALEQDDPEHALYRQPMQVWLSPSRVAALEGRVRNLVAGLIERIAPEGRGDLAASLAEPVPAIVMAMLLGLPESDWGSFRDDMARCLGSAASEDVDAAALAAMSIVGYLTDALDQRRRQPRDDLMTEIAQLQVGGRPLSNDDAVSMSFLLLGAGHETTVGAIGGLLYYLGRQPELQDRLRAEPSLVANAVEEALRLVAPIPGMARTVRQPISIGGVDLAEGDRVMLLYGSANRDPDVFDDPEVFRLDRNNNRHVAFGGGVHRCVGASLARLEIRVVCEELLTRLPGYRVDAAVARYATSRSYRTITAVWPPRP